MKEKDEMFKKNESTYEWDVKIKVLKNTIYSYQDD